MVAKLSLGTKFDSKVMHGQTKDPGKVKVVSRIVEVYATGLPNVFSITRHTNKFVYAMDHR